MPAETKVGTADDVPTTTIESEARSYCRGFPAVFASARGATLIDTSGREYTDFLAGCSSLNYGHNDPDMKAALLEYIESDGITHGLDMFTDAKQRLLAAFETIVLKPRGMDYRLQFTGPTGANAVEAALKIARKVTGRRNVIAFSNGFHGVTMGALTATANSYHRGGGHAPLDGVSRMPFDGFMEGMDTAAYLEKMLDNPSGGIDAPAAIIVETVQGEGGLNAASGAWLKEIQRIAHDHGALFIVDDIQAGCGRTGRFFSFETFGLSPDVVTMAKSLSGYGLPFALTLIKPQYDIWEPAEHNGTFRGNNHAFVTARVALEKFWRTEAFQDEIEKKGEHLKTRLGEIAEAHGLSLKGRGMMRGIDVGDGDIAERVCRACFERGLVIETSGAYDEVVKVLAPLTIPMEQFDRGLDVMREAFGGVYEEIRKAA